MTGSCLSPLTAVAQIYPSWQHCFGGSDDDWANRMRPTTDGGVILAGLTRSGDGDVSGFHGWADIWILKLDASLQLEWQGCYGGHLLDEAFDIIQTIDGGYAVVGGTWSSDGDFMENKGGEDLFILKLTSGGSVEWAKTFGGTQDDRAVAVTQTADGWFLVAGYTLSDDGDILYNHGEADILVLRLSPDGNVQWQKPFGGSGWDIPEALVQTKDYGFVVAGSTYSNDGDVTCTEGSGRAWVAKVSKTWDLQWNTCLPGKTAHAIISSADSGLLVGCEDNQAKGVLYKLDHDGHLVWNRPLKGAVYGIRQSLEGEILVSGQSSVPDSCRTGVNFYAGQLQDDGSVSFETIFGGLANDWARSVNGTIDGSYLLSGGTMSDDCDVVGNHNGYIFSDVWVMKFNPAMTLPDYTEGPGFTVAPNPAVTGVVLRSCNHVAVSVYDPLGQMVTTLYLKPFYPIFMDLSSYPPGLFGFLNRGTGKMVKVLKK